jgi:hypothetical protein
MIFIKLGKVGVLPNIANCAGYGVDWLSGVDYMKSNFPCYEMGNQVLLTDGQAQPCCT